MAWFLFVVAVVVVGVLFARRRHARVAIAPGQPIPTMYSTMSKRDQKKQAALDAASSVLR